MLGSNIIEIAIGVIFVFILFSTLCTAVREGIESWMKTRAAYLEQGIRQLLNDKDGTGIVPELYNHPLINGLFNNTYEDYVKKLKGKSPNNNAPAMLARGGDLPSYIPSKNFAKALLDIAARGPADTAANTGDTAPVISLENIRKNVGVIDNPQVQRIVLNAIDTAQGDLNIAQANLENWFNSGMDRVSGWYKRSTQWVIFIISLLTAILLNVNTISVVNYLAKNDTERKMLVQRAGTIAKDNKLADTSYAAVNKRLDSLRLPIGWPEGWESAQLNPAGKISFYNTFLGPLFGWLITALAAMLGAPYWFDILNKVMVIRSTVKPHEKSGEEASQDNQGDKKIVLAGTGVSAADPGTAKVPEEKDDEPDGCGIENAEITVDEELPESKGGTL